jgi:signal transduction histidine kinase
MFDQKNSGFNLPLVIFLILALLGGLTFWLYPASGKPSLNDVFTGVSALFTGLAFAVMIQTMILQRRELALQREELALTREELKRSATAQEAAEMALKAQAEAAEQNIKLAAIAFLIKSYETEIDNLNENLSSVSVLSIMAAPVMNEQIRVTEDRLTKLKQLLEELYTYITN